MARFYTVSGNSCLFSREVQQRLFEEGALLLNGQLIMDPIHDHRLRQVWPLFLAEEREIVDYRSRNIREVFPRGVFYTTPDWEEKSYTQSLFEAAHKVTKKHRDSWILVEGFLRQGNPEEEPDFDDLEEDYCKRQPLWRAMRASGVKVAPAALMGLGIETFDEARDFLLAYKEVQIETRTFGSSYQVNHQRILNILRARPDLPLWMVGVLARQDLPIERLGSIDNLFPACKAWRLSTLFWKDVAVRIGRLPLWKRIVAAGVIHTLAREKGLERFKFGRHDKYSWANVPSVIYAAEYPGCVNSAYEEIWQRDRSVRIEFWLRFNEACKPGMMTALANHAYDGKANRKRVLQILHSKSLSHPNQQQAFLELPVQALVGLKVTQFLRVLQYVTEQEGQVLNWDEGLGDLKDWMIPAAAGLVAVFGKQWERWLAKQASLNRSIHDATYWLPANASPFALKGLDGWLFKNGHEAPNELEIVARHWSQLEEEQKKLSFKKLLRFCRSNSKYEAIKDQAFAEEAAFWGISPDDYQRCEKTYLTSQNVPELFSSKKSWKVEGYTGRFLPRSDVRVGFFGQYTNCCQHFYGQGKSCAISSMVDPFSQLFVVEDKKGEIIAGSWVWASEINEGDARFRAACFDNVEAKGIGNRQETVAEIYQQAADWIAGQGYRKVTIGTIESDLNLHRWSETTPVKLPSGYSGITDANSQVLAAENLRAPNLADVSRQAAKVWVRGALETDLEEASHVAAACYPHGFDHVDIGENDPRGMLLMHESAGIIGYVTWDQQTRDVADMAVLPAYRRYAPQLIDALFAHCKDGEWWSGDFRESTSFRTIQRYSQRGRVEIEVGDVSHHIGDEPCYQVRFRVL
jgi:hypothetical protein